MTPYYADDQVTLYLGDCREVTGWLAADVLVTDPPYGMAYQDRQGGRIIGDESTATRDAALTSWGGKAALVFGTWRMARPAGTRQVLIWDKSQGNGMVGGSTSPWGLSHEEIYVLGRWPAIEPGGRWREGGKPARKPGVLRVSNYNTQGASRPDHPTPKPIRLMEELIAACPPGVIADPFAGSGSTLVAARNLGRSAIGVEIDERYAEKAALRLCQDVLITGAVG
jgi:site-specific DNA-methyltransferase (adenine-specific)